jgi:hypothetical protein
VSSSWAARAALRLAMPPMSRRLLPLSRKDRCNEQVAGAPGGIELL